MISCIRNTLKLLILITVYSTSATAEAPQYKIYLTKKTQHDQPSMEEQAATVFDCTDRIYIVVEALGLETKNYNLTVNWINPVGAQQEKTDYKFHAQPFTRVWAWLQLSGPPGAVIGQVFDPAFGMEEFIGEWSANVSINRDSVKKLAFTVVC